MEVPKSRKFRIKMNTFRGIYSFHHKKTVLSNPPQIICLEITNSCNLRCPICPMNTGKVNRKKTMMKKQFFRKIVDEYSDYMIRVNISHHGESLLHPDLGYMIRHLHKRGVKCAITTNATLLTKNKSRILLGSDLDYIMFSFDTLDKKTYESIRSGANFEKTLQNIENFIRMKEDLGKKTDVRIRTINMDATADKMKELTEYFRKMDGVDNIEVNEFNTWGGRVDRKDFISNQKAGIRKSAYCLQPWVSTIINSEGGVFVCNNNEDDDFGNLKNLGIMEIWNGKKYRKLRESILKRNTKDTICRNCDYESMGMYAENPNPFFPLTTRFIGHRIRSIISGKSKIMRFQV